MDDTILVLGAALWGWMTMDALKPGIVSLYWNLTTHWGILMLLIVLRLLMIAPMAPPCRPPTHFNRWQALFAFVLAGCTVIIFLRAWGIAAISLGVLVTLLALSLFLHYSYEETPE